MNYRDARYRMKFKRRDYSKRNCYGRCPRCREYKGSRKNEPGAKKRNYREFKAELKENREF